MPPLIVPSPTILDQSFPRSTADLQCAAVALGNLVEGTEKDLFHVYVGGVLREFVDCFDWTSASEPLFREIYRLHVQWLLQPSSRVVSIDLGGDGDADSHPLPCGISNVGLAARWALEVGRLYERHARLVGSPDCVGVSCAEAFAALPNTQAACGSSPPGAFATVGPSETRSLADAYTWRLPAVPTGSSVTVRSAKRNVHFLGGVVARQRGSHIPVTFEGARTWALDTNDDPVPETYLDELKPITGLPGPVIRSVLYYGTPVPDPVLRLLD